MDTNYPTALQEISIRLIDNMSTDFKRYLYTNIDFNARLIIIKGCRGVGKTTLLLQFLKDQNDLGRSIYLSLDHIFFAESRLVEYIDHFYKVGFRNFVLDEVHKYATWSIELKNIYDSYPDVKLLVTASSALNIMQGVGDLSRRADLYHLRGLSFREYLKMEKIVDISALSFDDILLNYEDIYETYFELFNLKYRFQKYLKRGYYPYYKEAGLRYPERLVSVINQVLEVDLPAIFNIDFESTRQVKKLLSLLGRISPYTPNIASLSRDLRMTRTSVLTYIDFLEAADLLHVLKSNAKSDSALTKPDKVYLENPNLLYALGDPNSNVGTIRETFVMNAFSVKHKVTTPAKGDLLVNDFYTIEIGGPGKSNHQISDMPNPILIKDGVYKGSGGVIPMWMLGLMW